MKYLSRKTKQGISTTKILLIVGIIGITATAIFMLPKLYSQPTPQKYQGPTESIRVGTVTEYSTLILIAQEQDFFKNHGLEVSTIEFDSGGSSFKSLLEGKVDIATAADFVGVSNSFDKPNFKAISSIVGAPNAFQIVALKNHGIEKESDLKGKKIGLTKKTMGEFLLGRFLTFHGIALEQITELNAAPPELKKRISEGSLDAIITFQPHIHNIQKELGENAKVFSAHNDQLTYTSIYANNSFINEHQNTIERFVEALIDAENFMANHPVEVKKFFKEQFNYSDEYISAVLTKFEFNVLLSQSMLLNMEDQARWVIENKLTNSTQIPNYLDLIYFDALEKIKPETISIIR